MTALSQPGLSELQSGPLAEAVHATTIGDDLVLLDLTRDDYLLLPGCAEVEVQGAILRAPRGVFEELETQGLVSRDEAKPERRSPPALPSQPLPDATRLLPTLRDIALFARVWADTAARRPTLQTLFDRYGNRSGRGGDLSAISRRVEVFRQLLPCAPAVGACLFQAEVLLKFLRADGLDADWVFGVRTWPFLAHCWLQSGDFSVSQRPETLTLYRPILVI